MSVTVRVPAKVNVQLAVGAARPDGFHDPANVLLAVSLYDEITATPAADGLRVTCEGPDADQVPLDRTNLAARAAEALAARYGREPDVHLHIAKDIPVAGGMAGGSADGAGALVAWRRPVGHRRLTGGTAGDLRRAGQRRAVQPGRRGGARHRARREADRAGGRRRLPLGVRAGLARVCPRRPSSASSTGWGKAWTFRSRSPPSSVLDALAKGDTAALAVAVTNDLQPAAPPLFPRAVRHPRGGAGGGRAGGPGLGLQADDGLPRDRRAVGVRHRRGAAGVGDPP